MIDDGDRMEIRNEPLRFAMIPDGLIWDTEIGHGAVRLYVALRRYGDEPADCFPSMTTLSSRLGVTTRAARRWVAELEAKGWVQRYPRWTTGGIQTSNGYLVRAQIESGEEDRTVRVGRTEESGGPGPRSPAERDSIEREPEKEKTRALDTLSLFDEFWAAYPRRTGKGAARTAWAKAVQREHPGAIVRAALRFRHDPNRDPQFTPHPATWLNQDRWEDDPLPSRSKPEGQGMRAIRRAAALTNGATNGNGADGPRPSRAALGSLPDPTERR